MAMAEADIETGLGLREGGFATYASHDAYNADQSRVRATQLKSIMSPQGPRAYYLQYVAPVADVDEEHDATEIIQPKVNDKVLGVLLHEYGLQGKVNWFVAEAKGKTLRRGSSAWREAIADNPGDGPNGYKWALSPLADAKVRAWRESLLRNKVVASLIESRSFAEKAFHFTYRGIPAKTRVDLFGFDGEIWDLKTSVATNHAEFNRQIENLRYDFQAAFYEVARNAVPEFEGMRAGFNHIVVSKKHPYYCYVWPLAPSFLKVGHRDVGIAFDRLAACRERVAQGVDPLEAWPDFEEHRQGETLDADAWWLAEQGFKPETF